MSCVIFLLLFLCVRLSFICTDLLEHFTLLLSYCTWMTRKWHGTIVLCELMHKATRSDTTMSRYLSLSFSLLSVSLVVSVYIQSCQLRIFVSLHFLCTHHSPLSVLDFPSSNDRSNQYCFCLDLRTSAQPHTIVVLVALRKLTKKQSIFSLMKLYL